MSNPCDYLPVWRAWLGWRGAGRWTLLTSIKGKLQALHILNSIKQLYSNKGHTIKSYCEGYRLLEQPQWASQMWPFPFPCSSRLYLPGYLHAQPLQPFQTPPWASSIQPCSPAVERDAIWKVRGQVSKYGTNGFRMDSKSYIGHKNGASDFSSLESVDDLVGDVGVVHETGRDVDHRRTARPWAHPHSSTHASSHSSTHASSHSATHASSHSATHASSHSATHAWESTTAATTTTSPVSPISFTLGNHSIWILREAQGDSL